MKTKTEFFERLDDLVFENRNRDYGAYAIRKSYSDNVNKAFFVALSIATLLVMLPFLNSMLGDGRGKISGKTILPPLVITHLTDIIIEARPKPPTPIAQHVDQAVVPTQVVRHEVVQADNIDVTATATTKAEPGAQPSDVIPSDGEVGSPGTSTEGTATTYTPPILSGFMAEYKGGQEAMAKFLTRSLRYPSIAQRQRIEGTVYVSFIVNVDGRVIRAEILRGISKECDEEAKRVVSLMPGWKAAFQNNMPVMVKMVLPIKFSLGDN